MHIPDAIDCRHHMSNRVCTHVAGPAISNTVGRTQMSSGFWPHAQDIVAKAKLSPSIFMDLDNKIAAKAGTAQKVALWLPTVLCAARCRKLGGGPHVAYRSAGGGAR